MIKLHFLGPVEAQIDGQPLPFRSHKALALLARLIVDEQPVTRLALIDLFWPDKSEKDGRNNLSWTLSHIHKVIPNCLQAGRRSVAFTLPEGCWVDILEFRQREGEGTSEALSELATLYRGGFLDGLELSDCPEFELWVLGQREAWRRRASAALERLTAYHSRQQAYEAALATARRWLALDDWEEKAHRQLMWLLAVSGRKTEALAHYERLRQILDENLAVTPAAETDALAAAIRDNRLTAVPVVAAAPPTALSPEREKQLILLDKIEQAWIKGVLEPALLAQSPIPLTWQSTPEAVARPWAQVNPAYDPLAQSGSASLVEIWRRADRALLISGEAGAGKTVTLLLLAQVLLAAARQDDRQPLPIILPLSSWAEKPTAFAEWLIDELNLRYQIPRSVGRGWLESNCLALLLDGLDEMPGQTQAQVMRAINAFREEHGLIGLVVCSRPLDVQQANVRLNLSGAITLQPLTTTQITAYLTALGLTTTPLQASLATGEPQSGLETLAHSPLWLSVMAQLYLGDHGGASLSSGEISAESPRHLFDIYVQRMFQRRPHLPASLAQTRTWLGWLARGLERHHQTMFLLEALQPDWLATRRQRWLYLAGTRLFFGAVIGLALSLYLSLREALFPNVGRAFYAWGQAQLRFLGQPDEWVVLWLLNVLLGGVVALVDAFTFEHLARQSSSRWGTGWRQTLITGVVVGGLSSAPFAWFDGWRYALAAGTLEALLFVLTVGYWRGGRGYDDEIRTVEVLSWSWRAMWDGLPRGLGLGAAMGLLVWPIFGRMLAAAFVVIITLTFMLMGGLRPNRLVRRTRPNQGLWLSWRNAILAGLLFALVLSLPVQLLYGRQIPLVGLNFGAYIFLILAGVYGGNDLVRHLCLRGVLWLSHTTPRDYVAFLDGAVARGFLRRVGGAYLFWHRALQEYFAASDQDTV